MNSWAIILAAGESKRFGGIKALTPWKKGTLLSHAIDTAKASCGCNVVVVTGAYTEKIKEVVGTVFIVHNPEWRTGMGSSIAAGIKAVTLHSGQMAIVMLADQPFVTPDHLDQLVDRARQQKKCVLSKDEGIAGPPAAIPASFFPILQEVKGDRGLKSILADYEVIENTGIHRDIDTPADVIRLQSGQAS